MSTYAIGDVQGCYEPLKRLLKAIDYRADKDFLWFCGDLINRGPDSLKALRFIKALVDHGEAITVLGNHDLHFLALAKEVKKVHTANALTPLLKAKDLPAFIDFLRQQPLCYYDEGLDYCLVHAGIIPQWDLAKTLQHAQEVQSVLQTDAYFIEFLRQMYGNEPNYWQASLEGYERLRFITNVLTRIRFCNSDGSINLAYKGSFAEKPTKLIPWFQMPNRKTAQTRIIFGHWAALFDVWDTVKTKYIFPTDSGCVWGNALTAFALEEQVYYSVPAKA